MGMFSSISSDVSDFSIVWKRYQKIKYRLCTLWRWRLDVIIGCTLICVGVYVGIFLVVLPRDAVCLALRLTTVLCMFRSCLDFPLLRDLVVGIWARLKIRFSTLCMSRRRSRRSFPPWRTSTDVREAFSSSYEIQNTTDHQLVNILDLIWYHRAACGG